MISLMFMEVYVPVVKQVFSDYYVTAILLGILLVLLLWRLRKFMNLYAQFPTSPILIYVAYYFVTNKIPKHLSFTAFIFQKLVRLSERFQKEGVFLLWLPAPIVFIYGENAVKTFSNEQAALDKSSRYEILTEAFGNGLVTSKGDIWRIHRKMLNPVFHVGMLKNKMSILNESAEILVKQIEEVMNEASIDLLELIEPCAFGILCECILGLKMNVPGNELSKQYIKLLTVASDMVVETFAQPWMNFKYIRRWCLPSSRKYMKIVADFKNMNRELIEAMKNNIVLSNGYKTNKDENCNVDDEARKSFAHILLDHHLKDSSFTIQDVQDQVATFMAAGYDTVSYALLWTLFLLGHHPEVQDQAYNEVDTISKQRLIYEDLHNLKYLECVIKETLRLYPPIPVYARKLSKDVKCGKYNFPKGTDIAFFPYAFHRNPEMYPDPEKFDPDRFLVGNSKTLSGNHIPFSEGIRNCIGKRFAMVEMKVVLAHILRNFRITSLDRKEDVDSKWRIVLSPVKPLKFRMTPRH